MTAAYGQVRGSASSYTSTQSNNSSNDPHVLQGKEVFDESGYIAILPCIFGYQQGLQFPFRFKSCDNIVIY